MAFDSVSPAYLDPPHPHIPAPSLLYTTPFLRVLHFFILVCYFLYSNFNIFSGYLFYTNLTCFSFSRSNFNTFSGYVFYTSLTCFSFLHSNFNTFSGHVFLQSDTTIGLSLMDRFTSAMLDFFQGAMAKEDSSVSRVRQFDGLAPVMLPDHVSRPASVGRHRVLLVFLEGLDKALVFVHLFL